MTPKTGRQSTPTTKLKLPKNLLFNIAGGGVIVLAGVLAVRSSLTQDTMPLCEARYARGVLFAFAKNSGAPLSTEEMQARLGGMDWGLTSNARIVPDGSVAKGHVLEVELPKASARDQDGQTRSGMGFVWQPRQLATASSVCLSYSVWVPTDFKVGDGGVLPGLASEGEIETANKPAPRDGNAAEGEDKSATKPFRIRAQWRRDGTIGVYQAPNVGSPSVVSGDRHVAKLEPGRWTRIEQEAVLNVPGQANGKLRLWVDGKLAFDRGNIGYRKDEIQSFQSVSVGVHYAKGNVWGPAPADTRIKLSPLELRVK
jgi:hypothetical protein